MLAKKANLKRTANTDLSEVEITLKKYIEIWNKNKKNATESDWRELSRVKYDLGYLLYLRGFFEDSIHYLKQSVNDAERGNNFVGMWMSKIIENQVAYYGNIIDLNDYEKILLESLNFFKNAGYGPEKNPYAIRWIMNTNAHLFELTCDKKDLKFA
ncbi:MAG: hypothetical protein ACFFAS_18945 [Promethearchaeota archaeon]